MTEHILVFPSPIREIPVLGAEFDPHFAIVVFRDPIAPDNIGVRHTCKTIDDATLIIAPRLTDHTVTGPEDSLTIRASIACGDCQLHGWITDGRWTQA